MPGRHKKQLRRLRPAIPVAAIAAFTFWLSFACAPDWNTVAGRVALASAMMNMPEGSIALLERRFADKPGLAPSTDERDVVPYVVPWEEKEEGAPAGQAAAERPPSPQNEATAGLDPSPAAIKRTDIPEEYVGSIVQENMAGSGSPLVSYGAGLIRNSTETTEPELAEILQQPMALALEDTKDPQVLIVHTHATESYEPMDSETFDMRNTWRSTDDRQNMTTVGDALAEVLEKAGIGVVHDKTQHDFPSYTGAYDRSAETIRSYLEKYPTIKIVLDVHRDAILRAEDLIVKPTVEINGKKAAQLMIITGCEDGTMNVPKWRENLRFAAALQDSIEKKYPNLTRPVFFCYRKYNMDLTTGSLLLEIGSNANTLEESVYSAQLIGESLVDLLQKNEGGEAAPESGNPV